MPQRLRSQRLNGLFPLSYMGVIPVSPGNFVMDQRPPTINDAHNFYLGDIWLDNGTDTPPQIKDVYMLVSLVQSKATWIPFSGGTGTVITLTGNNSAVHVPPLAGNINIVGTGPVTVTGNIATNTLTISVSGSGVIETLTGNSGGAVSPTGGNINVIGDTTTINIVGNPATHTLTASATGAIATTYDGNSGSATPSAHVLNIIGDTTTATTLAAGNTVTISSITAGNVATTYVEDAGSATPSAHILNIIGGSGVTTSGAGNTVTITAAPGSTSSSFAASSTATQSNVTGDSSAAVLICGTVAYNVGGNYNAGTGFYTAPHNGIYAFTGVINFVNLNSDTYTFTAGVGFSINGGFAVFYTGPGNMNNTKGSAGTEPMQASIVIKLSTGDTVNIQGFVGNTGKTVGFSSASAPSFLSGALLVQLP